MRFFTFVFILFVFSHQAAIAQPCAGPGRTAQTAFAVCGILTFPQANVPSCTGPDLPPMGCPDPVTSSNSVWYKFHCYQGGTLGFLISPNSAADDYDWELMDYTGRPPGDVYTTNLGVSLNLSAITGPTGCTPAGTLNINCAGGSAGTQYNRMPTLVAGHDYLLMVTNWSNSGLGYNLVFGGGTAVLTDNLLPSITSVGIVGCDPTKLKIVFSEDILCSSLAPLANEITISGGPHTITAVASACTGGLNSFTEMTLTLQNPIPPGNYTLTVNNGTDGDTYVDVCLEAMPVGTTANFTVPPQTPVGITSVTYGGCAPVILDVALDKQAWCSSITATGSEFSILPGNPTILSVQTTCGSGPNYTDTIQLVLQNPLPPGNYQLLVNNGTDGNTIVDTCNLAMPTGTTFDFIIAPASLPPVIQSIGFSACSPKKVVLNFDKPINCASLTATGSELSISPGVWPLSSITYNCIGGIYTNQITMNLVNILPAGNYSVVINNGTDANTLSDTCLTFIPAGYNKPFVATQSPPPVIQSSQVDACNPNFVKLFYDRPIQCSSVSPDGTDYTITGPSPVTILSATTDVTCAQGYTHWVQLNFASPISLSGTYTVHNGIGSDGDGIIDTCFGIQSATETEDFNAYAKPNAAFNSNVNWGCVKDTIVLSHPGGNGVNSWNWTFSDGGSASGQNVSVPFPVDSPSIIIQLIVSNGFCSDTASQVVILGNVFNASYTHTPGDTFCIGTPVDFINTSNGSITSYLWEFGDGSQYIGQTPPTHYYATFNDYTCRLIATDNHGCRDTASKLFHVTSTAYINFTGLRPSYCVGNVVTVMRDISRNITSYSWDNGNGITDTNKVIFQFSYPTQGVYTVTLTGNDKYCGPTAISKTVSVWAVPSLNLGPDTVLCPGERLLIGVQPQFGFNYTWNTGANTSSIYTNTYSRGYKLLIDNQGCRASDSVYIKVLPACLIKVPGAFTPNGDGLNDYLKAVNADLAKNFSLKVYNRFGQMLFSTNKPLEGWDGFIKGSPAEQGTYVWILNYTDPWTGKEVKTKGTSILLR